MSTCFLIVGQPRSGTSLLAGLLHRAGISMGERLMEPHPMNARGFFVDLDFEELLSEHFDITNLPTMETELPNTLECRLRDLIAIRAQAGRDWGVKVLYGAVLIPLLKSAGELVKVIRTKRHSSSSAASLGKYTAHDNDTLMRLVKWGEDAAIESAMNVQSITVEFDRLIESPQEQISRLADFVGLKVDRFDVSFIDPTMRHF